MRQLKITQSITNRASAALDKYLVEIGREDLITTDEEVELAQRIHKGDERLLVRALRSFLRVKRRVEGEWFVGEDPCFVNVRSGRSQHRQLLFPA